MILPAQTIRDLCASSGMVEPFEERTVDPKTSTTYGLSPAGYDVRCDAGLDILSSDLKLVATIEHFRIPYNVLAVVHDKSTWARRGLFVQNTVIEPGWRGYLTLELTYHGVGRLVVEAGTPIAQIVFHLLSEPTEQPYSGRYQDQGAGAQPAPPLP